MVNASWRRLIKALILDMDGVLWRDSEPIGDLPSIFHIIDQIGLRVVFATNNATRTVDHYVQTLASFGVQAEPWQIITSSTAVIKLLKDRYPQGGPVYIIGEQGLIDTCQDQGYYQSETNPLAVVAGFDRTLTFEKLKVGSILLRKGVPFIGTNPDHTFPTPEGLIPGAGSILAALTTASGIEPVIAGKPEPTMYQVALERLELPAEQVLVVGDRLETDIAGAQVLGCHTALVLSGVTNEEQAREWKPAPDLIADDLKETIDQYFLQQ